MATPWGRIRNGFLAGKSYKELSEKYGVTVKTIQCRASKEGWTKEKRKIAEEVETKIHSRVVQARVEKLEKLMCANDKLIDGLLAMAEMIGAQPADNLFDKAGTLKNAEAYARAINTAVETQMELYKLPSQELELKKKAEAARRREAKARLQIEKEKLEMEKTKAQNGGIEAETWQLAVPEGDELDG